MKLILIGIFLLLAAILYGGPMYVALFVYVVIAFVYYKHKEKKSIYLSKKISTTFSDNFTAKNKKKGLFDVIEPIIDRIDLGSDYKLISHSNVRLKCIQAGIRTPIKQKSMIFFRYALIVPSLILGFFLGTYMFPDNTQAHVLVAIIVGIIGFFYPVIRLDSIIQQRQLEISQIFPDFIDLMMVCVEAGMTAEQAYVKIAIEIEDFSKVMCEEVKILSAETTYFLDPKVAYDNFLFRTNNSFVKAFCTVILQSIQYGTPLTQGLRALSLEVRQTQMGEIERKAASLPSKLTVPMMLFTLPVLFVVISYPAAVSVMEKL